jgi:hypothetical protein
LLAVLLVSRSEKLFTMEALVLLTSLSDLGRCKMEDRCRR